MQQKKETGGEWDAELVHREKSVDDGALVKAEEHTEQPASKHADEASKADADKPSQKPNMKGNGPSWLLWLYLYEAGSSQPALVPRLLDSISFQDITRLVSQRTPPGRFAKALYGLLGAAHIDKVRSTPMRIRLMDDEDLRALIHILSDRDNKDLPTQLHIHVLLHSDHVPLGEPPPGEMPYERGGSSGRNDG
ncbi:MAG: hypothetical protein M1826_005347 [Phylliscum demangeonii]|nr:MAG: hypothetical protein M1826_005347 [Phylliscum demangeonii]